jgi:hypothetical protein
LINSILPVVRQDPKRAVHAVTRTTKNPRDAPLAPIPRQQFLPTFHGHLKGCVVNQNIDTPKGFYRVIHDSRAVGLAGPIARQQQASSASRFTNISHS